MVKFRSNKVKYDDSQLNCVICKTGCACRECKGWIIFSHDICAECEDVIPPKHIPIEQHKKYKENFIIEGITRYENSYDR